MRSKSKITFTIISGILGFMMAVQYQTIKNPVERDTRDIWEIQEDIAKEQQLISDLYREIRTKDETLRKYDEAEYYSKYEGIMEQLNELKKKIGLTELNGTGVELTISLSFNQSLYNQAYKSVPPELLIRLFNELYQYNAIAVSIDGQRVIDITPIRDVNGKTYVNNTPLGPLPIKIKVIAEDAEKLHHQIQVSQIADEFFALENLELTSEIQEDITVPAYDGVLRNQYMQPVEPVQ